MTAAQKKGQQAGSSMVAYQFKRGQCSYTFRVPHLQCCSPKSTTLGASNSTQQEDSFMMQMRLLFDRQTEKLENALRNSTQRLEQLKEYIRTTLGSELQQAQKNIVQNHTTSILQLGTSLLKEIKAQTLKLMDTQAQVRNPMSHTEHRVLEALQTTDKLEKQLEEQRVRLKQLHSSNSDLETRLHTLETDQEAQLVELDDMRQLREELGQQLESLSHISQDLKALNSSRSILYQQQEQLKQSLQLLKRLIEQSPDANVLKFQDCEAVRRFGFHNDGVYTIFLPFLKQFKRVFCVMDPSGGAWTVIQHRENGKVNFDRNWEDYKQGFGDPAGEHWLGNEAVYQLTSSTNYSLRVEMEDGDGSKFYANFEHFKLYSEKQYYRIFLDKDSGVSSRNGLLILKNNKFSTRDADHDNCGCNCSEIMSGGWWFDACGMSNLNGIYYQAGQHRRKIDGIRWDHASSDSVSSLRTSRMMMRPLHN
ncbi:angiopoietin-4-like [Octodon degus]|uniref:Angiopoietin-4-like n=1 Tax=Octodon degus TaxID=10160 RepID=A0A6P3F7D0_OCTDE|nr:angiopoietin-4-like [Octodon degus]